MTPQRRSPAPPSDAQVRWALAGLGRGALGCAALGILGLVQIAGFTLLVVSAVRGALGEEAWESDAALGAVLLVVGLISFRKVLSRWAEAPTADERATTPEELAEVHPDEPWRWNEEWANGRLHSRLGMVSAFFAIPATAAAAMALAAAAVLLSGSLPDVSGWREDPRRLVKAILIGLALILPALILGGLAARAWLVRWRFGAPIFEMRSVPAVIGGRLEGRILTGMRRAPRSVRLRLVCASIEQQEGKVGREASYHPTGSDRTELWTAEQVVSPFNLQPGVDGLTVPVAFDIPQSCRSTDWGHPTERISWTVHLLADVPLGVDLEAGWVVPVFKVDDRAQEP